MQMSITKFAYHNLTIPVASATAERSFSAPRRLNTFTRSRMTASRLNNIVVLHVHQERTDNLVDDDIIQEFVAEVDIRELTFGTNLRYHWVA
jgi:hypothetical protein